MGFEYQGADNFGPREVRRRDRADLQIFTFQRWESIDGAVQQNRK